MELIGSGLALAAALWQGTGPVTLPVGAEWIYEGRVRQQAEGRIGSAWDFDLRARYLVLEAEEPGHRFVLVTLDFGPGQSRFLDQRSELPARQWGTYLHLGPDLQRVSTLLPRRYEHPAADELELCPFPPADLPAQPGARTERERTLLVGAGEYRRAWGWRAAPGPGGLRISLEPPDGSVPERNAGDLQLLEEIERVFDVDPATHVLQRHQRFERWVNRFEEGEETAWETETTLGLVETAVLDEATRRELEGQFREVRRLLFSLHGDADAETDRARVDALLSGLEGSRVYPVARDLLLPTLALEDPVQEHPSYLADQAAELLGRPAPSFAGTDLDGNPVTLAELRGRVVMLNFWASW